MLWVFDTSILVSAIRSEHGASKTLVDLVLAGDVPTLISVPLLFEYETVLKRDDHLEASGLRVEDVDTLLDAFIGRSKAVRIHYQWRPFLPDPADDMVLETAINGGATGIVTFNRRDFDAAKSFGLWIVAPGEIVAGTRRLK